MYDSMPFCNLTAIEQPLGRWQKATCPPVPGPAMLTNFGYVIPMFFHVPVSAPILR